MSKLITSINRINSLEESAEKNTAIHHIHPMIKIITTIVYLIVVISFEKYYISGLIPFFVYPILLMSISDIPYKTVMSRLLIALPFSFFAGLSNIFLDRNLAYTMAGLPVTWGMISFTSIMLKTVLTVMAILILVGTTPLDKIAYQLLKLKVPKLMIMQFILTYRYLSLLLKEAFSMVTAYHLRSDKQRGIKLIHSGPFMGQLLLRSFDKADKVYYAMKCRGFNGEYRFAAGNKAKPADYFYLLFLCSCFISMRYINLSIVIGNMIR